MAQDPARLHAPTQAELDAFIDRKAPFIITGVSGRWPALARWTSDYLKAALREKILVPQVHPTGDYFDTWTRLGWPLGEEVEGARAVELVERPVDERRYYLVGPLRGFGGGLDGDLVIPDFVLGHGRGRAAEDVGMALLYGRDCATPLHYHPGMHALLCPVRGEKRVQLYRPEISRRFYVRSIFQPFSHHSDVNFNHLERYPRFCGVEPDFAVTLAPGELLYFPPQWWHVVFSPALTCAVQLVWRSEPRHYSFPPRSVRLLAHTNRTCRAWLGRVAEPIDALWRKRPADQTWLGSPERHAWREGYNAAIDARRRSERG